MSPVGSLAEWERKISRIDQSRTKNCASSAHIAIYQILTHHWTVFQLGRTIAFAMNKTAEKTANSSKPDADGEPGTTGSPECLQMTGKSELTAAELQSIQEEKLSAIRSAIARGVYDSDTILELAINRMLKRLEASESEQ